MMPKRIQLRRTKGWRLPKGAVTVARPTRYGNPFAVGDIVTLTAADGYQVDIPLTAELAVTMFRDLMDLRLEVVSPTDPADVAYVQKWTDAIEALRGKDLACWCPLDQPCHADVLLELANR